MTDVRKCCLLGLCCPPGSAEQRADMKVWLVRKLLLTGFTTFSGTIESTEAVVDSWLDELPWEKAGE